MAEICIMQQ